MTAVVIIIHPNGASANGLTTGEIGVGIITSAACITILHCNLRSICCQHHVGAIKSSHMLIAKVPAVLCVAEKAEKPLLSVPVAHVGVVVGKPNVIVDPDQKEPPRRRFVIICCSVQTAGKNQIHHILGAGCLDQNRRIDPLCQCFVTHDRDQL